MSPTTTDGAVIVDGWPTHLREAPTSGFYRTVQAAANDGGAPTLDAGRKYVEGLLRTADTFFCTGSFPPLLEHVRTAIHATVPCRALLLVEDGAGHASEPEVLVAGEVEQSDRARLESYARAALARYLGQSRSTSERLVPQREIDFPLFAGDGSVFAVLIVHVHGPASERDAAFLDAVAGQLAVVLNRARRVQYTRRAMEQAAIELAETRSALERQAFLAESLVLLNSAHDPASELGRMARLASHRIADGCVVLVGRPDALRRADATDRSSAEIDRVVARLLPRTLMLQMTLVASSPSCTCGAYEEGWKLDTEAEAVRGELGLEWLVCTPMKAAAGEVLGALLLLGGGVAPPPDARTVGPFARFMATAIDRGRPYRAALRSIEDREHVLSLVAHDLKQPLNAMLLNVSSLLRRAQGDDQRRSGRAQLQMIERCIGRLRSLTNDLLDVSSIDHRSVRLECTRASVVALLADATDDFAAAALDRGVTLTVGITEPLPDIHADVSRIHQVLANLIGNAIKFTPDGGTITVSARVLDRTVAISITDTGKGIPECDLASIFERFWQATDTASLGTGIGLTISKAIVEAHGGAIVAESVYGAGSTFTFTVPMADE